MKTPPSALSRLFNEIKTISPTRKSLEIEDRGNHLFHAAQRYMETIRSEYDEEEAEGLIKMWLLAVKSGDIRKFDRRLATLKESQGK